jgi:serine/threonine protein kinase/Tol biopolymer transport system component
VTQSDRLNAALADRYRIERELGQGGMATVYLAADLKHDRKVALKVLKPELAAVLGAERFVVEIKTTASLQHPHILPLFDSGTADGFLFYVMPFIEGETLRDKLNRETQLSVDEAVRIAREVAEALDYAHSKGVIHRDIKPENILLANGRPMVADFGIALAVSAAAGGRMTETGLSLGTPHYMSPEQATAEKEISARSDVYSLASVLFEMLAGEPPHSGGSAQSIIMKIIAEPAPDVTKFRKTVPPNVAAAVARALEKVPADRFQSAKAFADALGNPAFATTASTAHGGLPSGPRRVNPWMWATGAIGIAALASGWAFGRSTAPAPDAQAVKFVIELPDSITSVSTCCGPAQSLSPDGTTLVFVGIRGTAGALYRRPLDQLDAELIPGTEGGNSPSFSPNGEWLLFVAQNQLKKVPMAGGPVVPVANTGPVSGAAWGDNDTIVYARNAENRLWTVPASGGQPTRVPLRDSTAAHMYPSPLPGGRHVLAAVRTRGVGTENSRIGIIDVRTGDVDTLGYGTRAVYANGSLVMSAADNTVLAQSLNLDGRRLEGQATVMLTGVSLSGSSNHEFAISRNGWLSYEIARGSGRERLAILKDSGSSVLALPNQPTGNFEDPDISPDGQRILLRFTGPGDNDLWLFDRRQGTLTRFSVGGAQTPVWSPSGTRVAYYSPGGPDSVPGIYVQSVDRNDAPRLVKSGHDVYPVSWTPDERVIAFTASTNLRTNITSVGYDIGLLTLSDTTTRWLLQSDFNERQPEISPDGRRLAYTSNRTGASEVYVQSLMGDGVAVQVSNESGSSPRWSRDSRTLYFISRGTIVAAAMAPGPVISVSGRRIVARGLTIETNPMNSNWDVFPDGTFLVIDVGGGDGRRRIALIQNWPALARSMGAKQ